MAPNTFNKLPIQQTPDSTKSNITKQSRKANTAVGPIIDVPASTANIFAASTNSTAKAGHACQQ